MVEIGITTPLNIGIDLNSLPFNGTSDESVDDSPNIIISATVTYYVDIYLDLLLGGILAAIGTVTNVFNLIIFHKIGVNDSMSVGLVALSLSDFLTSFISLVSLMFDIWDIILPGHYLNPLAIHHVTVGWWKDLFFLTSSWITTYLSIERCVCVVFPFKVKTIFTKFRAIITCLVIFIIHVAIYMPVFVTMELGWTKDKMQVKNTTIIRDKLVARFSENRGKIMMYMDFANGAVLPIPSMALVLFSVLWMIFGLKASSKVRSSKALSADKEGEDDKKQSNLSVKERRLVKVVLFIAIILIICHIPRFISIYAHQIYPATYFGHPDEHLYSFLWTITVTFNNINASVNIFVYLIVNTVFRQKFKELFSLK